MKIVIITDAWYPQVNGVVNTLERTMAELTAQGHIFAVISQSDFFTIPCPTYPEIRLSLTTGSALGQKIESYKPDHIHIVTEGTLGFAARSYCLSRKYPFTTSYHTRFPEYIKARFPVPLSWTYAYLRRFHNSGNGCMVATPTLRHTLASRGFTKLIPWARGVDSDFYHPRHRRELGVTRPVQLYVGRVAVEKNIEAFLQTNIPGTKIVVGDGPARFRLQQTYREVIFTGAKFGEELAQYYASADVFIFPSLTDTFGIVMLEALASGVPVAAYPAMGPIDVIGNNKEVGGLSNDLNVAIRYAMTCNKDHCRTYAKQHSWQAVARLFIENVEALYIDKQTGQSRKNYQNNSMASLRHM